MRSSLFLIPFVVAGCAGPAAPLVRPLPLALPDSVMLIEAVTGRPVSEAGLLQRLAGTDIVLLGELHDNPVHHRVRARLINAEAPRRVAVVFEQFAASTDPLPPPAPSEPLEQWLDRYGFDRQGWRWPLHRPVVEAAIASARSIWGSNMSREALRTVVREGATGAPADLRRLMEQSPLDSLARALLDQDLVEGHCGQLPPAMIPGMRAAQEARDAAMARALVAASADGHAWLIAGNGHVRADIAVPRMLRRAAPGKSLLVIGLLERSADGTLPALAERQRYDLAIVTPPATREDPCARLRMRP